MIKPINTHKDNKRHRLTDIETEEVSIVDKGANKRKFAVIKHDQEANAMSADGTETKETDSKPEAILEDLNIGLEKLASLTEVVKTFVEKAEGEAPYTEWKSIADSLVPWVTEFQKKHFVTSAETTEEVAKTEEVKTEEVKEEVKTEETKTEEVKTEKTETTSEEVKTEKTETKTEEAKPELKTVMASATSSVLELATSTAITAENVGKVIKQLDDVYMSGGISINAYDLEALAKICDAVYTTLTDHQNDKKAMKKSADRVLADVSTRIANVSKAVSTDGKLDETVGKDVKIAQLLLGKLEKGLQEENSSEQVTTTTTEVKNHSQDDIQKLVDAAVAKALEVVSKKAEETTKKNDELTKQNAELVKQTEELNKTKSELTKKLSETQTRSSSVENVTKGDDTVDRIVHINPYGMSDYNAKGV